MKIRVIKDFKVLTDVEFGTVEAHRNQFCFPRQSFLAEVSEVARVLKFSFKAFLLVAEGSRFRA